MPDLINNLVREKRKPEYEMKELSKMDKTGIEKLKS